MLVERADGVERIGLKLPIDAVPDVTNVQVQVLTTAPALGPEEVERFITTPLQQTLRLVERVAGGDLSQRLQHNAAALAHQAQLLEDWKRCYP